MSNVSPASMRVGTRKRARPKIADKDNTKDLTYLTAFVTRKFLMLEFVLEEKLRGMPLGHSYHPDVADDIASSN